MTDITVSRELLQRMVNAIDMLIPTLPGLNDKGRTWLRDEIIESTDALRAALEQPAPVQEPDRIAQLEAANTNLFEQGQKMHKRIQELEMDCKIGAQEMVKAYEEIDNLKAQVSWQKPVAWCQLGLGGKSIAYFDGKPMIMTGHVGNQHHPTPLFTAQPRKANEFQPDWDQVKPFLDRIAELEAKLAAQVQEPAAKAMTAHRAAYFMERFKKEEKLLGPNEQAAVDFVIDMLTATQAPQPAPVQEPSHDVVAGAIFDFAGFLTSHKVMIEVGSCSNASPMVERIKEWSGNRGLSLENPDVFGWQMRTAQPRKAVRLTTDEIKEAIRHLYQDATALQMSMDLSLDEFRAIEAAVLKANGVEE